MKIGDEVFYTVGRRGWRQSVLICKGTIVGFEKGYVLVDVEDKIYRKKAYSLTLLNNGDTQI